jgi:aminopeptidase N
MRNGRSVCHEIAHMWFGNLVTMDWWTDIWLNEGFARFCEHLCLDAIHPELKVWKEYI